MEVFMQLYRLIYMSKPVQEMTQDLQFSIFGTSEEHNKELGITGILLATDKHFIQLLEGEKRAVNKLYHTIVQDRRHQEIELISFSQIEQKCFPEWSMKIVRINDLHKGIRDVLAQKYGSSKEDFCFPKDAFSCFCHAV